MLISLYSLEMKKKKDIVDCEREIWVSTIDMVSSAHGTISITLVLKLKVFPPTSLVRLLELFYLPTLMSHINMHSQDNRIYYMMQS